MGFIEQIFERLSGGGDASLGMLGNIVPQLVKVINYAIAGAIIFAFVYIGQMMIKLNKVVLVRKITAEGKVVSLRKYLAMEIYDKKLGLTLWKMPLIKKVMPKPDLKHITMWKKKEAIEVWEDSSGDLHPVSTEKTEIDSKNKGIKDLIRKKINEFKNPSYKLDLGYHPVRVDDIDEKAILKPVPQNRKAIHLAMNKRIAEKARASADLWTKYSQVIVPLATLLFVFLVMFFWMQHIGGGMRATASALGQVATSCRVN